MINNNKTIATAVLAVVMTVTALALASPQSSWDGALLTDSGYDSSVATTAAIPNMPDVWSAFDAVSDVMSFEWLIPSAFAVPTITSIDIDETHESHEPDGSDFVYINTTKGTVITLTAVAMGNSATLTYVWDWTDANSEPSDLNGTDTDTIEFTAPNTGSYFTIIVDVYDDDVDPASVFIDLLVLDASSTDNTPPEIFNAGDNTLTISVGDTYDDSDITCTDDTDPSPSLTSDITVNIHLAGTYVLTYSCVDAANNSADGLERTVIVEEIPDNVLVDDTPPEIFNAGDNTLTISVGDTYDDSDITCTDDTDPSPSLTSDITVNIHLAGTYVLTYSCVDAANNSADGLERTVIVEEIPDNVLVDDTPPEIFNAGDNTLTISVGDTYDDSDITCTDDTDPSPSLTSDITVNIHLAGTYVLTYSCVDAANNSADGLERTVIVEEIPDNVLVDDTPPEIFNAGDNTLTISVGDTYDDSDITCTDDTDPSPSLTSDITVNIHLADTYVLTYSCVDAANNSADGLERTVIVQADTTPPVTSDTDRSSKKRSSSQNNLVADNDITIDGQSYNIGSGTTTITPHDVMTGQPTDIVLEAYTTTDIIHFTVYLNLHDSDVTYSNSDTYVSYDHGVVEIIDPHGFISDASITITEDREQSRKKIIDTAIEFDGEMGLTNMVLYMWNEDRRSTFIRVLDAIDVTADAETRQNNASTAGSSTSARITPEPDVSDDNRSDGGGSQSSVNSGIAVIGGDANDDVQTLSMVRMWSGFASESITDAELLESMGLDNYPAVHIPNWVMTELGALVSNNDVTVEEFRTALVYMLEMLTA